MFCTFLHIIPTTVDSGNAGLRFVFSILLPNDDQGVATGNAILQNIRNNSANASAAADAEQGMLCAFIVIIGVYYVFFLFVFASSYMQRRSPERFSLFVLLQCGSA
jgi:hypothetical protein